MSPLRFRTKLLVSHIGLVVIVFALVSVLLERSLAADLEQRRHDMLVAQAKGATEWVTAGRHPNRVANRLAAIVQADVQIFDPADCVIGSSDHEGDGPHVASGPCVAPPEVKQARSSGAGRDSREKNGERFDFVAVPADHGFVLQFAATTREIDAHVAAMRGRLAIAALIAAFLALVLGQVAAQLAARPLRSMARQADRIARGDYGVRLPPLASDEFGQLADALASLAKQLEADMDRIQRLEITRRDFVANVTHELRTPVAAIQAFSETLQGDVQPEKARHFLDLMHKHAQRIAGLVDGLLRLADLEAQAAGDTKLSPIDLLATAREVRQTLAARAKAADVTVAIDVPEGCAVLGEQTRLEQVLENLADNAIKYGRAGGRVEIVARADGDHVEIRVADDGSGIEPEHLERIFERFYRVDAGRSRERGGAGLGLSIVKHLVESMGGRVRAESKVGHGTTFVVELGSAAVAG